MSPLRSRLSTPVQMFILMFYLVLVLVAKHYYDNSQRNQRFQQYDNLMREVASTLDMVEKHAKETAQAVKAIEMSMVSKKDLNLGTEVHLKPQAMHLTRQPKTYPP